MIRLIPNSANQIKRAEEICFKFDDQLIKAHKGETILVALMKNGIHHLRDAPTDGKPRGAFCCMGLCQECVVKVDGKLVESCETIATDGLIVQSLRH